MAGRRARPHPLCPQHGHAGHCPNAGQSLHAGLSDGTGLYPRDYSEATAREVDMASAT